LIAHVIVSLRRGRGEVLGAGAFGGENGDGVGVSG